MAFWIACSMKAIKEQIDEQPKIIKLFSINYARDLIYKIMGLNTQTIEHKEYRKVQGLVGESSFSIVLPKSFANALGIGKGDFVKVYADESKIIVEKAQ